jgi:hypothetical protein
MSTPITAGIKVIIAKGCKAREIKKGVKVDVVSVVQLGADYGHCVKIVLEVPSPWIGRSTRPVAFYVRHVNRLSDDTIGMNDGNPMHRIEVRRM